MSIHYLEIIPNGTIFHSRQNLSNAKYSLFCTIVLFPSKHNNSTHPLQTDMCYFNIINLIQSNHNIFYCSFLYRLSEIPLIKAFKSLAVTSFIPCHLMYRIMYCIKICCFSALSKICLSCSSTVFCFYSHFKVLLC